MRSSAGQAEVALALLGGAPLEVEELGALALERGQVLVGLGLAVAELGPGASSMSASSLVGRMSMSSARSSARVGAPVWPWRVQA